MNIFFRDNLLRLVIYYDDLSYELLEQKPSYDTLVWLGKFFTPEIRLNIFH